MEIGRETWLLTYLVVIDARSLVDAPHHLGSRTSCQLAHPEEFVHGIGHLGGESVFEHRQHIHECGLGGSTGASSPCAAHSGSGTTQPSLDARKLTFQTKYFQQVHRLTTNYLMLVLHKFFFGWELTVNTDSFRKVWQKKTIVSPEDFVNYSEDGNKCHITDFSNEDFPACPKNDNQLKSRLALTQLYFKHAWM